MNQRKNIIGFCSALGQNKKGVELFPKILSRYIKKGVYLDHVYCEGDLFKNLNNLNIKNNNFNLRKGNPLINVGGDHSMAISTVAASLSQHSNTKVLWIDAHPDINTQNSSLSGNFHGMPLSFLTGLDTHEKINYIEKYLSFDNLMYIGIRDIDKFERKILIDKRISSISSIEMNDDIHGCLEKIINWMSSSPLHISFDVDSIDPNFIYSTGTRVDCGIFPNKIKAIFQNENIKNNLINVDFTELNIALGNVRQSSNSINIIMEILNSI